MALSKSGADDLLADAAGRGAHAAAKALEHSGRGRARGRRTRGIRRQRGVVGGGERVVGGERLVLSAGGGGHSDSCFRGDQQRSSGAQAGAEGSTSRARGGAARLCTAYIYWSQAAAGRSRSCCYECGICDRSTSQLRDKLDAPRVPVLSPAGTR